MGRNGEKLYEFGPFVMDCAQGLLHCDGEPIHIPPKTFDLLSYFVANSGQVLDKKTLMDAVWPDTFVEDANLSIHISTLRKVFEKDESGSAKIETFPKLGYRLTANISEKAIETNGAWGIHSSADNLNSVRNTKAGHGLQDRRRKFLMATSIVAGLTVIAGLAYSYIKRATIPFRNMTVSKLTTSGDITYQSISPDGKYVVYWKGGEQFYSGGKPSLLLRQIGTGSEILLAQNSRFSGGPPSFSPEGRYVYYHGEAQDGKQGLYKIPFLGGPPIRLGATKVGIANISPDGSRIGTWGRTSPGDVAGQTTYTKVLNEDGAGERILASRHAPNYFEDVGPWSPDGRFLISQGKKADEAFVSLIAVNVDDGTERIIPSRRWSVLFGASWLPDMSGLVIAAKDEFSETSQLWLVAYPSGASMQITNDTNNYFWASMSTDGKTISAIQRERPAQIWSVAVNPDVFSGANGKTFLDTAEAKLISSNKVDGYYGLMNSPDGKVIFTSAETGNIDIWSMNPDGTGRRQLTTDRHKDDHLSVCGDGRHVVFTSNRNGGEHTWVMDSDGGDQRQLTFGHVERFPVCSPDGQWVAYDSWDSGMEAICRIPIGGGDPTQLTDYPSFVANFSPDGNLVSYFMVGNKLAIMPASGGPPVKTFDLPDIRNESTGAAKWTPDGQALTISGSEGGVGNIWIQPLDGEMRKLTNFTSQGIWSYDWSNDGTQLFVSRGIATSDIVLFSEAK